MKVKYFSKNFYKIYSFLRLQNRFSKSSVCALSLIQSSILLYKNVLREHKKHEYGQKTLTFTNDYFPHTDAGFHSFSLSLRFGRYGR